MKKFIHNERGAVAVVVALLMVVLTGFAAIVIDYGGIASERRSLQNAVDSACLAAAGSLLDGESIYEAENTAKLYVMANSDVTDENDITVTFSNNNKKVLVSASQSVNYTFARIITTSDSTTVTAEAAAIVTNALGPFDYALFSGSQDTWLHFSGNNNIYGDVHANADIQGTGVVNIYGSITAVGTIKHAPATVNTIENYGVLDMPDLSDLMDQAVELDKDTLLSYGATYKSNKQTYTMSSTAYNAMLADYPNDVIYINGNLKINATGVNTAVCVIVEGDITFDGEGVTMTASTSMCLYSRTGDITTNGAHASIYGMLYAPNGTVTMNGNGGVIYGSIISDEINCNGGVTVYYDSSAFNFIPDTRVKLVE